MIVRRFFIRFFATTLALSFFISLSSITVFASSDPFSGGEGTASNPYIIETIDQLEAVQFYRDSCFKLNNDLTFDASLFEEGGEYYNDGKGWTPIGKTYAQPFSGTFDGNGKTINGLKSVSDQRGIGLFGYSSGIVKNLNMEDIYICGDNLSESNCGGIIGYLASGKLINCKVLSGSVLANSENTSCGGLVGCLNVNGKVSCSINKSSVSSSYSAGGIAGTVGGNGGLIRECLNEGEISGTNAGGIVGGMFGLTLNDCCNVGNVSGSDCAGGLNGDAGNYSYLTNFFNTGVISGNNNVGSVSGNRHSCEASGCYSTANYSKGSMSMDGELISSETIDQPDSYQGFDFNSIWTISNEGPKLKNVNNSIIEHKLVQHPAVEATCITKGNNEYYICDYCEVVFKADRETITTVEDEVIPAKGHWLVKHEEVKPTCTNDGNYEYYTCANCDIAYKADMVTETLPKYEVWKATGHSWNEEYTIDKEATCIEDGLKSIHCANCDETNDSEVIPAKGHSWKTEPTIDKEASCKEEGSKSIHCSVCDAIDDSTVTVIPKADHTYGDWTVTKEATCTEDGSKEKVCSVCNDKVTETIQAKGHSWNEEYTIDKEASCTEKGRKSIHCAVCGIADESTVTDIPAKGHSFGDWVEVTPSTCEDSGLKQHTCDSCGFVESENLNPKGHDWESDFTVDVEATCTTDGSKSIHCKNCEAISDSTVIPAAGHSYGEWKTTKEPTCIETGLKEKVCSACGDKVTETLPIVDHSWNANLTVDKEATCTEEGSQSIHCSVCGIKDESTVTVIPKTDHAYGAWKVKKEATCTEDGLKERVCSVCDDTITEAIKAAGHKWNTEYTVDKKATYAAAGSKSIHCSVCDAKKPNSAVSIPKLKLATPAVSKPTAAKKGFTIKWKKVSAATGYQVQYALNSKFTKSKKTVKITKATTLSKKVTKLKAKKKYYVRVRAYKVVSGKTYYSTWCKAKTVITKK